MAPHFGESQVNLDVNPGREDTPARRLSQTPFRIAVLGDFSARSGSSSGGSGPDIAARSPLLVDRDSVDEAVRRFAPEVRVASSAQREGIRFRFAKLDDFHPDNIIANHALFHWLVDLRRRLSDARTFPDAARELRSRVGEEQPPSEAGASSGAPAGGSVASPSDGSDGTPRESATAGLTLLEQIVGGPLPGAADSESEPDVYDLRQIVRRLVAPHVIPNEDPRQAAMVEQVENAISAIVREILHDDSFQAVEALYRGIDFLARRVETSTNLTISLIDISRDELHADMMSDCPIEATATYRALASDPAGSSGEWSLLAGCYIFGGTSADFAVLERIAHLASRLRACWISGASSRLAGAESAGELSHLAASSATPTAAWNSLRRSEHASHLGLALPRFLLRMPYGERDDPCESIRFEEMTSPAHHSDYLWGNPAIACAVLLAASFTAAGWGMRPGRDLRLEGLPLHLVRAGGEVTAKPCAEALLTESAAERILDLGLMPIASLVDQDIVRLPRMQSVAYPPSPLAGRWTDAG